MLTAKTCCKARCGAAQPSIRSPFQIASTRDFTAGSMVSMAGQGRVKPSAAHLRVASMPILLP